MTKLLALFCSVVVLGLVAAGCGGDDEESSGGGGGEAKTQAQTEEPSGGTAAKKTAAVSMKDIQFNPESVTIAKGGKVTWTNDEAVNHDVTKTDGAGPAFASGKGNMGQGDSYTRAFTVAGAINYECTVHPGMAGKVVVK